MEETVYEEQTPFDTEPKLSIEPSDHAPLRDKESIDSAAGKPKDKKHLPLKQYLQNLFGGQKISNTKRVRKPSPRLKALPKFEDTVRPAMERLTDELIEETVGENGELTRRFRDLMSRYNPDENPIGPHETYAILLSMLDFAAAQRKLLNGRLESSVEVGSLYQSYYGRIQTVNTLAARALTDLERMEIAEEDYRFNLGLLLNVRDESIKDDLKPKNNNFSNRIKTLRQRINTHHNDIMQTLDNFEQEGNSHG